MEELPVVLLRYPLLLAAGLFCSLIVLLEIGRALGRKDAAASSEPDSSGVGLIRGSVFALLGLLVALSFSGATTRLEMRRAQIVEEANAISTARLRVDVLPEAYRTKVLAAFDRYVRSRADAYALSDNREEFRQALRRSAVIQQEIWTLSVEGGRQPDAAPGANVLLLPALNNMIDITTTRAMAMRIHTPAAVYLVLWLSALAASLLAGHSMAQRDRRWLDVLTFALVVTLTLYVLIDLEYPRLGLVRIDSFDALLLTGEP